MTASCYHWQGAESAVNRAFVGTGRGFRVCFKAHLSSTAAKVKSVIAQYFRRQEGWKSEKEVLELDQK